MVTDMLSSPRTASPPPGTSIRSARQTDLADVHVVVDASDRADLGAPRFSRVDVEATWGLPSFDVRRDAWVVETANGDIVGAAWLVPEYWVVVAAVAPDARRAGIGAALSAAAEKRACELVPVGETIKQHIVRTNAPAARLLQRAGYARTHSYLRMRMDLTRAPTSAGLPDRVRLEPVRPMRDDEDVYELAVRSFARTPDFTRRPARVWCAKHLREPLLYTAASPLAWEGDRPLGLVLAERAGPGRAPRIAVVAVDPHARGRGIGRALVLASARAMARNGATELELDVLEGNPAVGLYESVGMKPTVVQDRYEKRPARPCDPR
jgi:mycothiol synthase